MQRNAEMQRNAAGKRLTKPPEIDIDFLASARYVLRTVQQLVNAGVDQWELSLLPFPPALPGQEKGEKQVRHGNDSAEACPIIGVMFHVYLSFLPCGPETDTDHRLAAQGDPGSFVVVDAILISSGFRLPKGLPACQTPPLTPPSTTTYLYRPVGWYFYYTKTFLHFLVAFSLSSLHRSVFLLAIDIWTVPSFPPLLSLHIFLPFASLRRSILRFLHPPPPGPVPHCSLARRG